MKRLINKSWRLLAAAILVALPLQIAPSVSAAGNVQLYLSPASGNVTQGSNVIISVMLKSGGNKVSIVQPELTYSTANLSFVSAVPAAGSPYTFNPTTDKNGNGVIEMTRYMKGSQAYDGAIITITLKALAAGSTTVNFQNICAVGSSTTKCSAVIYGPNNLLNSISGGSFMVNAPGTGGSGSGSGGGSTIGSGGTSTVTVTVVDRNGKPVSGAKVVIDDASGTTDKNGNVTLEGLAAGDKQGTITYDGKEQPINLKVQAGSASKFTVKTKKASPAVPAILVGVALAIGTVGLYVYLDQGRALKRLIGRFRGAKTSPAPVVDTTTPIAPAPVSVPQAPVSSPAAAPKLSAPTPMTPGVVITPNENEEKP